MWAHVRLTLELQWVGSFWFGALGLGELLFFYLKGNSRMSSLAIFPFHTPYPPSPCLYNFERKHLESRSGKAWVRLDIHLAAVFFPRGLVKCLSHGWGRNGPKREALLVTESFGSPLHSTQLSSPRLPCFPSCLHYKPTHTAARMIIEKYKPYHVTILLSSLQRLPPLLE